MIQEDGYIEVTVNLFNRTPVIKRIRPVYFKKLKLLLDVYCWIFVSRESDLDFTDMDSMKAEEFLIWAVYGGYMSYQSTLNKRPRITVEDAQEWIKGMLQDERLRVMDTIQKYKELGEIALSYQKAAQPQGEDGQSKKEVGSDQRN